MICPVAKTLSVLHEAGEPLSLNHLGARTGIDHTTLARVLRELCGDRLVTREIRPHWNRPGSTKGGKFLYAIERKA